MAQRKADDKVTMDQILKLADQLTPADQEELIEEMKLRWLRREIQKGIDEADSGELVDGKEVFAELRRDLQKLSEQQ